MSVTQTISRSQTSTRLLVAAIIAGILAVVSAVASARIARSASEFLAPENRDKNWEARHPNPAQEYIDLMGRSLMGKTFAGFTALLALTLIIGGYGVKVRAVMILLVLETGSCVLAMGLFHIVQCPDQTIFVAKEHFSYAMTFTSVVDVVFRTQNSSTIRDPLLIHLVEELRLRGKMKAFPGASE